MGEGISFSDTDSSVSLEIEIFLRENVTWKTKKLHNLYSELSYKIKNIFYKVTHMYVMQGKMLEGYTLS